MQSSFDSSRSQLSCVSFDSSRSQLSCVSLEMLLHYRKDTISDTGISIGIDDKHPQRKVRSFALFLMEFFA
ncbi:hypothetical protein Tco_1053035 [Tanacetum coccineum]